MANPIPKTTTHPPLKTPLVAEVVFEIRFPVIPTAKYGLVPGRLYEATKDEYPDSVEMPAGQIPLDIGPSELPRSRFTSRDGSHLIQLGTGLLSVNSLSYTGFSDFYRRCNTVLSKLEELDFVSRVNRLGLRYINKAAMMDLRSDDMINVKVKAPEIVQAASTAHHHQWLTPFNTGMLSTTIAWPTRDDTTGLKLVIDLDYFSENKKDFNVNGILRWLEAAHEDIYMVFKSVLRPSYFSSLESGR